MDYIALAKVFWRDAKVSKISVAGMLVGTALGMWSAPERDWDEQIKCGLFTFSLVANCLMVRGMYRQWLRHRNFDVAWNALMRHLDHAVLEGDVDAADRNLKEMGRLFEETYGRPINRRKS